MQSLKNTETIKKDDFVKEGINDMIKTLTRLLKEFIDKFPKIHDQHEVFIPVVESNRELCLELIRELQDCINNPYRPLHASSIFMTVPVNNITRLLVLLRSYNRTLHEKKAIDPNDCNWSMKTITLDQFFISDDQYYIDAGTIVEAVGEIKLLCEYLDGAEQAEYGVDEHNNRMLMKLFMSLKSVLAAFLQVLAN